MLRAVLLAVALMFTVTSIPDAEARRKPAVTAKKKTVKKAPKKRTAKKAAKKKPKKKRRTAEKTEPRRPLP